MSTLIGFNFFGMEVFKHSSPSIRNINKAHISNAVFDEFVLREKTDVDITSIREDWEMDFALLAKFKGDLEAGNISGKGIKIVKFAIKRRSVEDLENLTLGYIDFNRNEEMTFDDYTQPNDKLIYSVVPVGENGLESIPNEIEIESSFTGWWLVDKDTNDVLGFDKAIGSVGTVENTLNQGRTIIETFSKYPTVYYDSSEYSSFTLNTVIIPEEWERSGKEYKRILDKFSSKHKPFLVKSDTGNLFVMDISNIRTFSPQNTWHGYDYFNLSVDCLEVMDYSDYMIRTRIANWNDVGHKEWNEV